MLKNSPTGIYDFKHFPGVTPRTPFRRGRGRGREGGKGKGCKGKKEGRERQGKEGRNLCTHDSKQKSAPMLQRARYVRI